MWARGGGARGSVSSRGPGRGPDKPRPSDLSLLPVSTDSSAGAHGAGGARPSACVVPSLPHSFQERPLRARYCPRGPRAAPLPLQVPPGAPPLPCLHLGCRGGLELGSGWEGAASRSSGLHTLDSQTRTSLPSNNPLRGACRQRSEFGSLPPTKSLTCPVLFPSCPKGQADARLEWVGLLPTPVPMQMPTHLDPSPLPRQGAPAHFRLPTLLSFTWR